MLSSGGRAFQRPLLWLQSFSLLSLQIWHSFLPSAQGRGDLVAQNTCTHRQPTAGHGRCVSVVIIPTKPGLCPPGPAKTQQAVLSWSLCLFLGCWLGNPVLKHSIHPARKRTWECNLSGTVPSEAGHLKVNIPALMPSFKSWEGMIALLAGKLSSGRLCFT